MGNCHRRSHGTARVARLICWWEFWTQSINSFVAGRGIAPVTAGWGMRPGHGVMSNAPEANISFPERNSTA